VGRRVSRLTFQGGARGEVDPHLSSISSKGRRYPCSRLGQTSWNPGPHPLSGPPSASIALQTKTRRECMQLSQPTFFCWPPAACVIFLMALS
jgi:hypothetical protein